MAITFFSWSVIVTGTALSSLEPGENHREPRHNPFFASSLIGGKHPVIMYIPNRIFDIIDIIRLRVRVGPGLSVGARATEFADVFLGAHSTGYIGLRGARGKTEIPWPFGPENNSGLEVSVIDTTGSQGSGTPYNDPLEVGLQAQALLIGFNIGLELFEVFDLATGLLFIDLQDDDF